MHWTQNSKNKKKVAAMRRKGENSKAKNKKVYWQTLPENKEKMRRAALKGAKARRLNKKSKVEKAIIKAKNYSLYAKKGIEIKIDYLKYLIDKLTEGK